MQFVISIPTFSGMCYLIFRVQEPTKLHVTTQYIFMIYIIMKLVGLHTSPNTSNLCNHFDDCVTAANKSTDGKKLIQWTGNLLKIRCGSAIFTPSAFVSFHICCRTFD